ncbi:MAG: hypothetical protein SGJ24_18970 [Chloroflexota bacterium]|nr:hypothetical protein [Chloroflexota bacterium]
MSDYTTVQRLRAAIGSEVSNSDDAVLSRLITAVSGQIDRACRRPDGFIAVPTATVREFPSDGRALLDIDECIAVTLVEARPVPGADYTPWDAADWRAFSGSALAPHFTRTPFTAIMVVPGGKVRAFADGRADSVSAPMVRVTARWGYAASVPGTIETACIIGAARLYKRGASAYQDAIAGSDVGMLSYRRGLDAEVEAILRGGHFLRPRV